MQPLSRLDETAMSAIIDFGSLLLRFLHSKDDTDGSVDIFEMTLQPHARMPVPHYHDRWDETIYGLSGTLTFRVEGQDVAISSGQSVFIKRGVVHAFSNVTQEPAICLAVLTPGVLGPAYFREIAD